MVNRMTTPQDQSTKTQEHELGSNPYTAPSGQTHRRGLRRTWLAPRWKRFAATVLNAILGTASGLGVLFTAEWLRIDIDGAPGSRPSWMVSDAFLLSVALAPWMLWNLVLIHTRSQSIGKWIMKIKVIGMDGERASMLRQVFVGVGLPAVVYFYMPYMFVVDNLFVFTRDQRTLHDRIAGTKVVEVTNNQLTV